LIAVLASLGGCGSSLRKGIINGKQVIRPRKEPMNKDTLPPGLADHPDYEIKWELGRGAPTPR
jgi:hypothetical protein